MLFVSLLVEKLEEQGTLHCIAGVGVFRLCCLWFLVLSVDRRGAGEGRGGVTRVLYGMDVEALLGLGIWVWNCLYVSIAMGAVVRCCAFVGLLFVAEGD